MCAAQLFTALPRHICWPGLAWLEAYMQCHVYPKGGTDTRTDREMEMENMIAACLYVSVKIALQPIGQPVDYSPGWFIP